MLLFFFLAVKIRVRISQSPPEHSSNPLGRWHCRFFSLARTFFARGTRKPFKGKKLPKTVPQEDRIGRQSRQKTLLLLPTPTPTLTNTATPLSFCKNIVPNSKNTKRCREFRIRLLSVGGKIRASVPNGVKSWAKAPRHGEACSPYGRARHRSLTTYLSKSTWTLSATERRSVLETETLLKEFVRHSRST